MHLADAEVAAGVEGAPVGDGPRAREQPPGLGAAVAEPGEAAHLLGDLVHLLAGLEEPLRVAPAPGRADVAQVGRAERHQAACGVEDVDGRRVEAVGVAHGVGQDGGEPGGAGDAGHPRRVGRRARPPLAPLAAEPVGDQLDHEVLPRHHLAPRRDRGQGEVVAAAGRGDAELGGRAQEHHDVATRQVGREQVDGGDRTTPLAAQVDRGDHPAQRGPPGLAAGQEGHPSAAALLQRQVARRSPAHRRTTWGSGKPARPRRRRHRQLDAEHRPDPGAACGPDEPHRTVGAVAVGQRERVHLLLRSPLDEHVRVGGAVLQREAGGDVEVDEGVRRHLTPRWRGAPARAPAR